MPTTVLRLSGTTFLILEPGDNLFMPLKFVLLRSRLIPSLCSDSLLTGMDFLETLLLLFPTIPVIPAPCLLLRAGLPVVRGTEVFLSLTELPIRELLLEFIRLVELTADGLWVVRVVGFLVVIELPIRELLLELIRLLELADDCLPVPELTAVGLLLLRELVLRSDVLRGVVLLDGLRVLEVVPGRVVTGRLTVTLLG